jgi:hypothetical protein
LDIILSASCQRLLIKISYKTVQSPARTSRSPRKCIDPTWDP